MKILSFKHNNGTVWIPVEDIRLIELCDDGRIGISTKGNYLITDNKFPRLTSYMMDKVVRYIFDFENTQIMNLNDVIVKMEK